jgi:hypothetical protein
MLTHLQERLWSAGTSWATCWLCSGRKRQRTGELPFPFSESRGVLELVVMASLVSVALSRCCSRSCGFGEFRVGRTRASSRTSVMCGDWWCRRASWLCLCASCGDHEVVLWLSATFSMSWICSGVLEEVFGLCRLGFLSGLGLRFSDFICKRVSHVSNLARFSSCGIQVFRSCGTQEFKCETCVRGERTRGPPTGSGCVEGPGWRLQAQSPTGGCVEGPGWRLRHTRKVGPQCGCVVGSFGARAQSQGDACACRPRA